MQRRRANWLISVTLLLLAGVEASGQRFSFRRYGPESGLTVSLVFQIGQDTPGYLWIAGFGGVSRLDGTEFRTFDVSTGLADQRLYAFARDSKGVMWLGTAEGAASYDGWVVRNIREADGLAQGVIGSIVVDSKDRIWLGSRTGGLSVNEGSRLRTYTADSGLVSDSAYALKIDSRGRLWIGSTDHGAAVYDISGDAPVLIHGWTAADGLGSDSIHAFAEEEDGSMIIGTRGGGLVRITGDRAAKLGSGIGGSDVYELSFNTRGQLIVATLDAGVAICSGSSYETCLRLEKSSGLPSNWVTSVFEDREQNLWIGTDIGLFRWSGPEIIRYTEADGLPGGWILSVRPDGSDRVWLSTRGGAILLDTSGTSVRQTLLTTRDGLPSNEVWHTLRDSSDVLWIGTRRGLCRYDPSSGCTTFTMQDGLPSNQILDIFEARDGTIWIGTGQGASRISSPTSNPLIESFTPLNGLGGPEVRAIAQTPDGKIWLAGSGVNSFDGTRIESWGENDGLGTNAINDLLVSPDGTVWLATNGAGLARFAPAGPGELPFVRYDRQVGLPSDSIVAMADGGDGTIWLATMAGLVQIDALDAGSGELAVVRHLTSDDGIGSIEGNGHLLAKGPNGDLWLGLGRGGLTRLLITRGIEGDDSPVATVETVMIDGGTVFDTRYSSMSRSLQATNREGPVRLNRGRDLVVEYRGVTMRRPHEVRYQLQLDGYDRDWSPPLSKTSKEYTNLPPGDYVFRVRARRGAGSWSKPASLQFSIPPAWWETTWFRAGVILLIGVLLILAHGLRTLAIRRRSDELEELVSQRTAALAEKADELTEANTMIAESDRAKSRFLASMSHELRTPLNSIIGFTEILLERGERIAAVKGHQFLTNVRFSALHLLALINDVLDLSKVEAGKMEVHIDVVSVENLAAAVIETVDGLASPRGIRVRRQLDESLPPVYLDAIKVRQILYNLLSNAVKFSPSKAVVNLAFRFVEETESELGVDSLEITVSDQGPGIPPDQTEAIFDAYRQARDTTQDGLGTGLGLAIVRKFSEMLGGTVTVDSVLGQGSTFRVCLPVDARQHETDTESSKMLRVVL